MPKKEKKRGGVPMGGQDGTPMDGRDAFGNASVSPPQQAAIGKGTAPFRNRYAKSNARLGPYNRR